MPAPASDDPVPSTIIDPHATVHQPHVIPLPQPGALPAATARSDTSEGSRTSLLARLSGQAAERYALGGVIGQGGMGQVVEALDRDLGRTVALKRVRADAPAADYTRRLLTEARITGQLEHPGVVAVHDVGQAGGGEVFYTMQLVRDGLTLRQVIDGLSEGEPGFAARFTLERRVRLVQQVAHTLHYAHQKGVVHRDVKPENIVVGPCGEVYLLDWGVARVLEGAPAEAVVGAMPGGVAGTPAYMAPEQARGQVTPQCDVYALCAVLFELVMLRHPSDAPPRTLDEVRALESSGPARPVACQRHDLGAPALRRVCARGLETDPARRLPSAFALEAELQGWLEGRARVTCPATFAVRVLRAWARAVEAHPRPATLLTYGSLLGLLGLLVTLAALAFWR